MTCTYDTAKTSHVRLLACSAHPPTNCALTHLSHNHMYMSHHHHIRLLACCAHPPTNCALTHLKCIRIRDWGLRDRLQGAWLRVSHRMCLGPRTVRSYNRGKGPSPYKPTTPTTPNLASQSRPGLQKEHGTMTEGV